MGSLNRAARRKVEKKAIRNKLKIDDVQERAAEQMRTEAIMLTVSQIMRATAMVLILNYKDLQKREGRMERYMDLAHEYLVKMRKHELSSKEMMLAGEVDDLMRYWWSKHEEAGKNCKEL